MNNQECHLPRHGHWMTLEGRRYLFQQTMDSLIGAGYQLNSWDKKFLVRYKEEIYKLGIKI